jgi:cytochrome c556
MGLACILALLLLLGSGASARAGEHSMTMSAGDTRQPLPLTAAMAAHQKQNMRDHLAAIQAVVGAIGRDDMNGVVEAAARLGYSEAMGQMCEHMGAAAPGFTPMALDFHRAADTIGDAARRGDRAAVLSALDRTLQACVGCHSTYRQDVVDDETWKRLTTPSPP